MAWLQGRICSSMTLQDPDGWTEEEIEGMRLAQLGEVYPRDFDPDLICRALANSVRKGVPAEAAQAWRNMSARGAAVAVREARFAANFQDNLDVLDSWLDRAIIKLTELQDKIGDLEEDRGELGELKEEKELLRKEFLELVKKYQEVKAIRAGEHDKLVGLVSRKKRKFDEARVNYRPANSPNAPANARLRLYNAAPMNENQQPQPGAEMRPLDQLMQNAGIALPEIAGRPKKREEALRDLDARQYTGSELYYSKEVFMTAKTFGLLRASAAPGYFAEIRIKLPEAGGLPRTVQYKRRPLGSTDAGGPWKEFFIAEFRNIGEQPARDIAQLVRFMDAGGIRMG